VESDPRQVCGGWPEDAVSPREIDTGECRHSVASAIWCSGSEMTVFVFPEYKVRRYLVCRRVVLSMLDQKRESETLVFTDRMQIQRDNKQHAARR